MTKDEVLAFGAWRLEVKHNLEYRNDLTDCIPFGAPFARGLVRDFRVRWALEEAGIPYRERLIGPEDLASSEYRTLQRFGQVPAIETDELKLFESGAIVFHIAERSETLMPSDAKGRARTVAWMFAALHSVEPPIQELGRLDHFHAGEAWAATRRPTAVEAAQERLAALEDWLGSRPRLSRRPVHSGGSADDHGAAHRAPHRHCVSATGAEGVSGALRGAAGLPKGDGGPPQAV
jgi:hypothetical protein